MVNYDNVFSNIRQMQSITANEGQQETTAIRQVTSTLKTMGSASNGIAIELADMLNNNIQTIVTATLHYLLAISNSAQTMQTEENIIAANFNELE